MAIIKEYVKSLHNKVLETAKKPGAAQQDIEAAAKITQVRKELADGLKQLLKGGKDLSSKFYELIKKGADINAIVDNNSKQTILHLASSKGNKELVKLLLEHKDIDISIKDAKGKTAADIGNGYIDKTIKNLIDHFTTIENDYAKHDYTKLISDIDANMKSELDSLEVFVVKHIDGSSQQEFNTKMAEYHANHDVQLIKEISDIIENHSH